MTTEQAAYMSILFVILLVSGLGLLPVRGEDIVQSHRAPQAMQSMIEDGAVVLVFTGELQVMGTTHFNLRLSHQYGYSHRETFRDGLWHVRVKATLVPVISITHAIRLPLAYNTEDLWDGRLVRHEFDHVAISLDPRVPMLLEHLCWNTPAIKSTLDHEPTADDLRQIVNDEMERRRMAVQRLIQANYVLLDQVSEHGTWPVLTRQKFFQSLYERENLIAQGFPYIDEVADLLVSEAYFQSPLRFLPRDPTEK